MRLGRYQSTSAPERAQRAHEDRGRGDAVDVVVAVDGDPRAPARRGRGSPPAASRSPPNAERCASSAARNAARPPASPSPRRTSTCASTCETPSSRPSRSAAAKSYGAISKRASSLRTHVKLGPREDGTAVAARHRGARPDAGPGRATDGSVMSRFSRRGRASRSATTSWTRSTSSRWSCAPRAGPTRAPTTSAAEDAHRQRGARLRGAPGAPRSSRRVADALSQCRAALDASSAPLEPRS